MTAWHPDILWLNVTADGLIALAYYAISLFLVYLSRQRRDLDSFKIIFVMFALFILACGTTHIMDIATVWWPAYALQGVIKWLTAGISVATAIVLVVLMPKLLKLPSLRDLEEQNLLLGRANAELRRMSASIESHVAANARGLVIEEALQKNQERFRQVIEAAPNGLLMVDRSGKVTLCNAEVELLFGYRRDELIGQDIELLVPARFRQDHPGYRDSFFVKPETRQMGAGRDLYGLRKDGQEFPIEIGLNPLVTDEGVFVLAAIVDITKRKGMEAIIQKSSWALQRKNQEMEQFVYTVSHDLKSPLVTSTGFLGLLKEDLLAERYDKLPDSVGRLERANSRMSQLIDDLLQLSRIGRIKLEPETIDIGAMVQVICENLAPRLKEKNVMVRIQEGMPPVVADRKRVYQAFDNLIINALKYAGDGPSPAVDIGWEDGGGVDHHFFVKDNGPGIAPQYHKKIFDLFQRLESDSRGTGVGLTIVERIMQQHGGRVWVQSMPGSGATFWLAFPRRYAPMEDDYDA